MHCSHFLESYSAFRDGTLEGPKERRRVIRHLATCPQCARYHEAIDRGVLVLRRTAVSPSRMFAATLERRLAGDRGARPVLWRSRPVRWAATAALAAGVIGLVGGGLSRRSGPALEAVSPRTLPLVRNDPTVPFVTVPVLAAPETIPVGPANGSPAQVVPVSAVLTSPRQPR